MTVVLVYLHPYIQLIILISRKGRLASFFPLKDSYGTTQLIVNHSQGTEVSALADVPTESSVLIEGTVLLRPQDARRQVASYHSVVVLF